MVNKDFGRVVTYISSEKSAPPTGGAPIPELTGDIGGEGRFFRVSGLLESPPNLALLRSQGATVRFLIWFLAYEVAHNSPFA